MILSWVLRGRFEKKNYFYILFVFLFFLWLLLSTRTLSTRCVIESGAELQPYQNFDWALRRPNGKSLRLTRRFRHHFSFERRLQHKTNVISPAASQWGQIMLSCSLVLHPPPPMVPDRPINVSEAFSVFSGICEISAVWGDSCSCLHRWGRDSRWARLIEAKTLSPTSEEREDGGVLGGGKVLFCLCLMSCKMHPSEWKPVMYCCKKWSRCCPASR